MHAHTYIHTHTHALIHCTQVRPLYYGLLFFAAFTRGNISWLDAHPDYQSGFPSSEPCSFAHAVVAREGADQTHKTLRVAVILKEVSSVWRRIFSIQNDIFFIFRTLCDTLLITTDSLTHPLTHSLTHSLTRSRTWHPLRRPM